MFFLAPPRKVKCGSSLTGKQLTSIIAFKFDMNIICFILHLVFFITDIYSYREGIKPAIDKITGDKEKVVQMEVDKKKIYEHAMARYIGKIRPMRTGMKPTHECPVITFTGEDENEFDVDGSGFRRQYYSIFFQECLRRLFEGSGRNQLPKHDLTKKDEFTALGIAIVEAILNGDCGFPYLNNAVFMSILGKSDDEIEQSLNITDIPLGDVWNTVKKASICFH